MIDPLHTGMNDGYSHGNKLLPRLYTKHDANRSKRNSYEKCICQRNGCDDKSHLVMIKKKQGRRRCGCIGYVEEVVTNLLKQHDKPLPKNRPRFISQHHFDSSTIDESCGLPYSYIHNENIAKALYGEDILTARLVPGYNDTWLVLPLKIRVKTPDNSRNVSAFCDLAVVQKREREHALTIAHDDKLAGNKRKREHVLRMNASSINCNSAGVPSKRAKTPVDAHDPLETILCSSLYNTPSVATSGFNHNVSLPATTSSFDNSPTHTTPSISTGDSNHNIFLPTTTSFFDSSLTTTPSIPAGDFKCNAAGFDNSPTNTKSDESPPPSTPKNVRFFLPLLEISIELNFKLT